MTDKKRVPPFVCSCPSCEVEWVLRSWDEIYCWVCGNSGYLAGREDDGPLEESDYYKPHAQSRKELRNDNRLFVDDHIRSLGQ